jgi:hypothetical protein
MDAVEQSDLTVTRIMVPEHNTVAFIEGLVMVVAENRTGDVHLHFVTPADNVPEIGSKVNVRITQT